MIRVVLAFILGVMLVSCTGWGYRFYVLRAMSYDGKLISDKPENDLALSVCTPTATDKAPCILMMRNEFYLLKRDFQDLQIKLDSCQRNGN